MFPSKFKPNLVWFCFAALLTIGLIFPIQDGDVFFYLSIGRMLFETGGIAESDPFLFTVTHWNVHHEWLSFLAFYISVWLGGMWGLMTMKVVMWLATFGVLIGAARKWKIQDGVFYLILFAALLACCHRFVERASLFSDLFLALLLVPLLTNSPLSRRVLWLIPLLFAVWVNLHAGYLIGLAFYSAYAVAQGRKGTRWLWLSVAGSYLACLVNPKFVEGALYPVRTAFKPEWAIHRKINFEWMPTFRDPFLSTWEVRALIVLLVMTTALMVWSTYRTRKLNPFACIAFLLFVYLAQNATRFMTTSALGFALLSAYALRDGELRVSDRIDRSLQAALSILFAGLAVFIGVSGYPSSAGHRHFGIGPDEVSFPVKAIRFMEENRIEGPIFNQYEWGSYLIWTRDREKSLFIHTHVDDPTFLADDYYGMSRSKEIFDQTVEKYGIRYFLLDARILKMQPRAGLATFLDSWNIVYQDETSVLWAR